MNECEYGQYCMCASCEYQQNKDGCAGCDDCFREQTQVHDVWTCTKYERKHCLINPRRLFAMKDKIEYWLWHLKTFEIPTFILQIKRTFGLI